MRTEFWDERRGFNFSDWNRISWLVRTLAITLGTRENEERFPYTSKHAIDILGKQEPTLKEKRNCFDSQINT